MLGIEYGCLTSYFFIILNLAVGVELAGAVGLKTVFPAQLVVDYVRVH